ncbi:GNAT-like protein [Encephalitozoon hellem]|nr:GNAT-like protein [Encephalitozoon hellem]
MKRRDQVLFTVGAIAALTVLLFLADSLSGNRKPYSHRSDRQASNISIQDLGMSDIPIIRKDKYILRGLDINDYEKGFIDCMNQLTKPGVVTKKQFEERYRSLCKEGCYKIIIAYDPKVEKVIGSGTLFIEKKFIRGCVTKGHIEDLVVLKERRGEGIGRDILEALISISKEMGCYKTALVCDPKNLEFYKKCGLAEKEREMVMYH